MLRNPGPAILDNEAPRHWSRVIRWTLITLHTLKELEPKQAAVVLEWAKSAEQIIQAPKLAPNEKIVRLKDLENTETIKVFLLSLIALLQKHTWTERSWPARLSLVGLTLGAGVAGTQAAGIAALGSAIGIPFFLLTASGGALVVTIIQELSKENR